MNLFWSDEDQKFYTIPDGDIATHKQVKEYYEDVINNKEVEIYDEWETN